MAGIKIGGSGAILNPTSLKYPVRIGNEFVDSVLNTNAAQSALATIFPGATGGGKGLYLDSTGQQYGLGDVNNVQNNTAIVIDDATSKIKAQGLNIVTAGGVHVASGNYLNLTVNGVSYLITLLTP